MEGRGKFQQTSGETRREIANPCLETVLLERVDPFPRRPAASFI